MPESITAEIPAVLADLEKPYRYKVFYSGRGAGKSWSFARVLLKKAVQERALILCCREVQNSIGDSVHRLLSEQIRALNIGANFKISASKIQCYETGSEFIFKGLRSARSARGVQSFEGIKYCWVEEAQGVLPESLEILTPTVRLDDSEIWFSFNPCFETDAVWQMFGNAEKKPHPSALVRKISWRDNPFFPETLKLQLALDLSNNPFGKFLHTWEGELKSVGGSVFRRDWWKSFKAEEKRVYDLLFISANTAYSQVAAESDKFSVLQLWGFNNEHLDLLDSLRGIWTVPELIRNLNRLIESATTLNVGEYGGTVVGDTNNNQTILKILQDGDYNRLKLNFNGQDSLSRAYFATQYVHDGNLRIPVSAVWLDEFLAEASAYQDDGTHAYTRQIDALTQACKVWRSSVAG